MDTKAKGYELEAVGAINDQRRVSRLGWTDLKIEDADGNETRLYHPAQDAEGLDHLRPSLGPQPDPGRAAALAAGRRHRERQTPTRSSRPAYGVTDLMAGVDADRQGPRHRQRQRTPPTRPIRPA
ncbi:hypothetical protein ACRAWD_25350 [Caulobacter segnis]